jgi:hypothetical protein
MRFSINNQSFEHQWAYSSPATKNAVMTAMKMRSFIGFNLTYENLGAISGRRLIKTGGVCIKKVLRLWRRG